jgi:tetratricopeptide (TPR) repeat protein
MKMHAAFRVGATILGGAVLAGCACVKHVPPGQSLSMAMAKKPEVVAFPPPKPQPKPFPSVPGAVPAAQVQTEKIADSFTLGNLCMQEGRYAGAIVAYQAAVKADPTFAEAWNNLAVAYQDLGQDDKAMEAFKKYKMAALH